MLDECVFSIHYVLKIQTFYLSSELSYEKKFKKKKLDK